MQAEICWLRPVRIDFISLTKSATKKVLASDSEYIKSKFETTAKSVHPISYWE